jgi:uncharacterized protein with GYD domain
MPFFLHQWNYKDQQVRKMLVETEDRKEVVRMATEAFDGRLHHFFYCFGEYDGMAISEYPSHEAALASMMSIFGQGRISDVRTTVLFTPEEGMRAIRHAHEIVAPAQGEPANSTVVALAPASHV